MVQAHGDVADDQYLQRATQRWQALRVMITSSLSPVMLTAEDYGQRQMASIVMA
jgi:hypothetical protein